MDLHFLRESNLRDRLFVQQYVHAFKPDTKALIIVDGFGGTLRDSRFVTKRLSTLMSEQMVYNNAFTGDQRKMVELNNAGDISLRKDFIGNLLEPVQAVLLGAIGETVEGPQLLNTEKLVTACREAFEIDRLVVFVENPMSPIVMKQRYISEKEDIEELLSSYEEEKEGLELALRLAPAILSGPNFALV